jgi:hypothetical protein
VKALKEWQRDPKHLNRLASSFLQYPDSLSRHLAIPGRLWACDHAM